MFEKPLTAFGCVLAPITNGERTNRVGHLGEVVDGLIRIAVQPVKSSVDLVQSGTIFDYTRIGPDSIDLGLILL